jgi:hypothetical protein
MAFTLWRVQRERQVGTQKISEQVRGTYILQSRKGGDKSGHKEEDQVSGLLSGWHRECNKSEHGEKAHERGALTYWRVQRGDKSGHGKEASEREALTPWRAQRYRQIGA